MEIDRLKPDKRNANRGTARGRVALQKSLADLGAGRSILLDRSGNVIAGNKTAEAARMIGIGNVRVVETDGTELVAVMRTDLDIDSPKGRQLALADNRVGELGLDWDPEALKSLADEGLVDLGTLWGDNELAGLLSELDDQDLADLINGGGDDSSFMDATADRKSRQRDTEVTCEIGLPGMKISLYNEAADQLREAVSRLKAQPTEEIERVKASIIEAVLALLP